MLYCSSPDSNRWANKRWLMQASSSSFINHLWPDREFLRVQNGWFLQALFSLCIALQTHLLCTPDVTPVWSCCNWATLFFLVEYSSEQRYSQKGISVGLSINISPNLLPMCHFHNCLPMRKGPRRLGSIAKGKYWKFIPLLQLLQVTWWLQTSWGFTSACPSQVWKPYLHIEWQP